MRVLHVIPSLAASQGGPSKALRLMESSLRARGIEVETVTTDDDGAGGRFPNGLGEPVHEEGGLRRYFRKSFHPYKVSLALRLWLLEHVHEYDVVHVHTLFSFSSLVAAQAARRARVPYIVRPLGTLARYGLQARRPWLKRLSLRLIESRILREAAAVHFTSEQEREEAVELGIPMRSAVVPLAVEAAPAAAPEALWARFPGLRGQRFVLFLSRLDPKKNVENLLHAIAAFPDRDLRWLLAGDGEPRYVRQLAQSARALGLDDRLIWAGHLEGESKAAAFGQAAAFVLPSLSENFGIAAAEALIAGLPVVLGQGVALAAPAAAAGAGMICGPDPESIRNSVESLLADPDRLAAAALHAEEFARRELSTESMASRLEQMYSRAIAGQEGLDA